MWKDNDDRIIRLLNIPADKKFPEICPICGKQSGHIYMHRYNENHGGIWAWCSSCHNYAHLSGIIPCWWENYEEIDENNLNSIPEYLDQNVDRLDSWINNLTKYSEEDGIVNLRVIGVYNEMPYGKTSDLSIMDFIGQEDDDNILKICNYLEHGIVIIHSSEVLNDVIDYSKGIAGTATALTDGVWLWPGDLSYYVRNYKLKLSDEFIKTMVQNEWKVPDDALKIDLGKVSVNGIRLK